eukprot:Amastigsp_a1878_7.p4 type:complete len:200 gc:universal Amastigsp_a1878_7:1913-1314(-)
MNRYKCWYSILNALSRSNRSKSAITLSTSFPNGTEKGSNSHENSAARSGSVSASVLAMNASSEVSLPASGSANSGEIPMPQKAPNARTMSRSSREKLTTVPSGAHLLISCTTASTGPCASAPARIGTTSIDRVRKPVARSTAELNRGSSYASASAISSPESAAEPTIDDASMGTTISTWPRSSPVMLSALARSALRMRS